MAANLPVFTNKDQNRAKNKKAADEAIPFIYETVIAWGCQKEEHETFLKYYNRREEKIWNDNKNVWEKAVEENLKQRDLKSWSDERKKKEKEKCMRSEKEKQMKKLVLKERWTEEDKIHLDQDNCEGLDTTLLHKLVPTICDNIFRYDPNVSSSTKIEEFLREVKNKRNNICHDPKHASVSSKMIDEVEVSAIKVFNAAGNLYASTVDKQTVQDKIDEFKKMLQKIQEEVMTDEQHRIMQTATKMSDDGLAEMQEVIMQQTEDKLPLSDDEVTRADIFHPVDFLIVTDLEKDSNDAGTNTNTNDKVDCEIPCYELLEHFRGHNVLCEGQPGTGKTTLLKTLREDFITKGKTRFHGVRKFDLLMYMECRNNSLTTIEQLLEHQFPKTVQQLNKEEAVKALLELNLLICVDGLDELTSHSKSLLKELVSKFGHRSNATFIFTSRPGQTLSLSLNYQTVTVQPITEEIQQVEFLRRYQDNIKGFKGSDLIKAFLSLNDKCKACLCQPVNLTLFCALFRKYPQDVKKWNNELNLMNDFLRVSKLTMIERMDAMNLNNPDCFVEKVTNAIFDLSLCLLEKQQMTFTLKSYYAMCQDIFDNLDVPYYPILSLFITKHSDQQTFHFFHKSSMEFLAAKAIEQKFLTNPNDGVFCTIDAILKVRRGWIHNNYDDTVPASDSTDGKDVSLRRCNNVMRFVIMMMAEGGSSMKGALKSVLKEVCHVLAKEKVVFSFWVDLTLSCPDCDIVAQAVAQAANAVSDKEESSHGSVWWVRNARDMMAVSRMLRFHQPARLDVRPPQFEGLPVELKLLLEAVAQWHGGQLDLNLGQSFFCFDEIDDLVNSLDSERFAQRQSKFTLRQYRGCLGPSRETRQVLVAAVRRAETTGVLPDLDIALADPRRHRLQGLEGTRHRLYILAQLNPSEASLRCPLPRGSVRAPELTVNCRLACEVVVNKTASLIEDLAPQDRQYYMLSLQQWPGSDGQLDQLLQQLSDSGVSTTEYGSSCWEPHGAASDGRCNACLSVHQEGWGRCLLLVVAGQDSRNAADLMRVFTDDDMREVMTSLPHVPLSWLEVRTWRGEATPPALGPLLDAVAVWHRGKLDVNLFNSFQDFIPVDEFLARLSPAECLLVSFVGCLGGSCQRAWRALEEAVQRAEVAGLKQVLAISLLEPWLHNLGELEGTQQSLEIRVRLPSGLRSRRRRPLPTSSTQNPWLTVECRPAAGGGALTATGGAPAAGGGAFDDGETTVLLATALIEDLAPKDMTYRAVFLQHYLGPDDALNRMVEQLTSNGVSTTGGGTSCWIVRKKDHKEECLTCLDTSHRSGERCVRLRLA